MSVKFIWSWISFVGSLQHTLYMPGMKQVMKQEGFMGAIDLCA